MPEPLPTPNLRVGCAMWAKREWVGPYFPLDTPPGNELETYATWCSTVEGNTTFYALPSTDAIAKWCEQTSEEFRFCFKLPRGITHQRRLRNVREELAEFLARIEPLGPRIGPVQIQLPASFGPQDSPALESFLDGLPRSFDWALEVRHPGFFAGGANERPLNDELANRGINRVILDSRSLFAAPPVTDTEVETWEAKPRLPVRPVATADHPLVRLIGQSDLTANLTYWESWADKTAEWLTQGLEPHVFTHTPDNNHSVELARNFWDLVKVRCRTLSPLPTPRSGARQLGLDL